MATPRVRNSRNFGVHLRCVKRKYIVDQTIITTHFRELFDLDLVPSYSPDVQFFQMTVLLDKTVRIGAS